MNNEEKAQEICEKNNAKDMKILQKELYYKRYTTALLGKNQRKSTIQIEKSVITLTLTALESNAVYWKHQTTKQIALWQL